MKTLIAPSILSADFARLADEIKKVEDAGADAIHVDVMDGHFVPNITIGPPVVQKIRGVTKLPFDCHLMIEEPQRYIEAFVEAGADWISVHVEACDLKELLPMIKGLKVRAGCAINPPTPVQKILPYLHLSDFVLVMTVNPGFGGQKLIEPCVEKIAAIKSYIDKHNLNIPIEVDGGINKNTVSAVKQAGASIIVAGNAIFSAKNYSDAIKSLR